MRIMRNIQSLFISVTIASTMLTGCESEEEQKPEPSQENTSSKASALTTPVEDAAQSPSGSVDKESVHGVFAAYADMDIATLGAELPAGLDVDLYNGVDLACVTGDSLAGTVDMACATGGEATGTLTYEIAVEGSAAYVYAAFDALCIPSEDLCMSGEAAVETGADGEGASTIVAGELTITQGGVTDELHYGVTVIAGAGGLSEEVVLWHNGSSYVVSVQIGAGGASYSVEGANGAWSCDITDLGGGAVSGSCLNGADSIDL